MMQDFSCRCVAARAFSRVSVCMHVQYVCLIPRASLHAQTDVLCLSRVVEVRALHLPLISFPSSLLSQASVLQRHVGDTCVPVAALENQVTLQSGRHYSRKCKGARFSRSALSTRLGGRK